MATPPTLSLCAILCESKRIINAHSRHFLALSVVFLLPLSFSLIVSPTIFHLLSVSPNSSHIHILLRSTTTPHHNHQTLNTTTLTLLFSLSFSLFLLFFSLFALSSITHSILHGFFGRPVKLHSAIISIFPSFVPLLSTTLFSHLILLFITLFFALLFYLLIQTIQLLGIPISYSSPHFLAFSALFLLAQLSVAVYLRVSWTLVSVIAVVESSYGLVPLKRSASLMKGMRGVGLASFVFFGFLEGVLVWSSSVLILGSDDGGGAWWKDWAFVLRIVLASTMLMLLLLYNTAANTVLYMYCKAVHGELALEIAEEFVGALNPTRNCPSTLAFSNTYGNLPSSAYVKIERALSSVWCILLFFLPTLHSFDKNIYLTKANYESIIHFWLWIGI